MTELDSLWEAIHNYLRKNYKAMTYANLIAPAKAVSLENNVLTITLPNKYLENFWQTEVDPKVKSVLFQQTATHLETKYALPDELREEPATPTNPTYMGQTPLNPEYTFDNFIQGQSNVMAYASAYAASEDPGGIYNPLLIYGGVGLGKTHLMQAIANNMLVHNPNAKIKYVTSENFINDYVNSIKNNSQEQFRQEYRNLDALLVDDVQFLSKKEGTQLEFFNTFNSLHDNNKQIVLTADRNPNEIPDMTDRLVSRFMWGIPVEITSPNLETRIAILRSKAEEEQIDAPNKVLNVIASHINTNVRELEGALMKVKVLSQIKHEPISLELAQEALQGMNTTVANTLDIDLIQKRVASYYKIDQNDIIGRKRTKNIVVPRQIAMYLSRELTDNSLPQIGKEFGGKDHTTVLHAIDKIEKKLTTDPTLKDDIQHLKMDLQQ